MTIKNGGSELPKNDLPTKRDPRITFRVQCFGHECTGLIYRELNPNDGVIYWVFRVEGDTLGCECFSRTEAEAMRTARQWESGHLRFALECWCNEARMRNGFKQLVEAA